MFGLMRRIDEIAEVAHQANKTWCELNGDFSQMDWKDAPEWQRKSAINGVCFHMDNPNATPEASHENWLKEKVADGWVYGPVKDVEKKTHPCCRPYEELPVFQRVKDHLFKSIVNTLIKHS